MTSRLWGALGACVFTLFSLSAHAALISRLGGQAVYDTDRDITWLADFNLPETNTFGVGGIDSIGKMSWDTANSWIAAMNADGGTGYLGIDNWRLPTTLVPDNTCNDFGGTPTGTSRGFDCTGSDMGHLFYEEFNADRLTSVLDTGDPAELAKFTNTQAGTYWSGTTDHLNADNAYVFSVGGGIQGVADKDNPSVFSLAWAVVDGDVSAVPVPAAVWLFGSGLLGLIGFAKRKAAK